MAHVGDGLYISRDPATGETVVQTREPLDSDPENGPYSGPIQTEHRLSRAMWDAALLALDSQPPEVDAQPLDRPGAVEHDAGGAPAEANNVAPLPADPEPVQGVPSAPAEAPAAPEPGFDLPDHARGAS